MPSLWVWITASFFLDLIIYKTSGSIVMLPIEYEAETNKETARHVPLHNICLMYKALEKQKEKNNAE